MADVFIKNDTRRKAPRVPFLGAANAILPGWDISLVFVGKVRAQKLNKQLRNKTYVPNVLSYEVGKKSGEVIICLDRVAVEHKAYDLSPNAFCLFLFIHALLHLKGYRHGTTMESAERAYLARFINVSRTNGSTKNRNRN